MGCARLTHYQIIYIPIITIQIGGGKMGCLYFFFVFIGYENTLIFGNPLKEVS